MNKEEIIVQISTGGYLEHKVTHEAVCGKLMQLLGTIAVSKVIIGWSCSRELYEHVTGFLRQRGIECYLWLPVFSETGVLKADTGKLVDDTGTEAESYCLTEGENFEFYCPDQQRNITSFLQIYEEHFDGLGFDGVFLDKIRYGSFSNGLGGVFSCFCPACMKRYQECGIDVDELKHQMGLVRDGAGGYGEQVLGITAYDKGNYTFAHPVWEKFYRKKAEVVLALTALRRSLNAAEYALKCFIEVLVSIGSLQHITKKLTRQYKEAFGLHHILTGSLCIFVR